jgi:hypothetical protein
MTIVTVSDVGLALILLDQEQRNNLEQKKRLYSRMLRAQAELDELSKESLSCQHRIDACATAIERLQTHKEYDILYPKKM